MIGHLSERTALMVFDNCEHVIDESARLIDRIVEKCPGVSVLATSREALELEGEQVYPVSALSVDSDSPLGSESAQLFVARASLVRPDFEPSPDEAATVEGICRQLDGIPLAVELAAAQVAQLSPSQIHERLGDRFRLLTSRRRGARRQQTLQAALDWSHALLDDRERVAFRRLSVFAGSFSPAGAGVILDDPKAPELVGSLARKSMVVVEHSGAEHRYRLLESVRVYAAQRLLEAGEDVAARDRHRDHLLAWVESLPAERTLLDPDGVIRAERDNLQAALGWSHARGRSDLVARIASMMTRIWFGDVAEGRRWLSIGTESVEALSQGHRARVSAVSAQLAVVAMDAFDGELARRAVAMSEGRPGIWSSLAHALLSLNTGIHAYLTKDPALVAEAERLGLRAVELADEPVGRGLAWFWLGQARVLLDDIDGAIAALAEGAVEIVPGGDMSPVSLALLAGALHLRGRHDEALSAAAEVLERRKSFQESGLWAWVIYCSLPYALELGQHGRPAEALAFFRDLLEDSDAIHSPGITTSVIIVLAALAEQRGDIAPRRSSAPVQREGDLVRRRPHADRPRPTRPLLRRGKRPDRRR